MKPVYKYDDNGGYVCGYKSQVKAASDAKVDESSIRYSIKHGVLCGGFYYDNEYHGGVSNILVIGDLHEPFARKGYLEFCESMYKKYDCNEVVFIGDMIDMHYSSFHNVDPDGHSAARELQLAKLNIAKWHDSFPGAKVCEGNHCAIPNRKAFSAGLSKSWIKSLSEVLDTPTWEYSESFMINDVLYTHGTGRKAGPRMKADMVNVVQGHYHSEGYITHSVGINHRLFAMQVGAGVDDKSYAMAYGKHFNKMHVNCGLVLNNGTLPILEYMEL